MIEKFTKDEIETVWEEPLAGNVQSIYGKINELCDIINTIQKEREAERFEIQEWIAILEAVRKSVNIHEKQIDELQMKLEPHKCEPAENGNFGKIAQDHRPNMVMDDPFGPHPNIYEQGRPTDLYAEQRKWIGKLCRCWDSDINDDTWGILQDIKDNKTEKYYLYGIGYEHCEPVKPDDDIIYKGGNNE